jgi:hypothetical protein
MANLKELGIAHGERRMRIDPNVQAASASPSYLPRHMPLFIPRDQVYYWTHEWQQGIRESMAAYEAGDYAEYDSDDPSDVERGPDGKD